MTYHSTYYKEQKLVTESYSVEGHMYDINNIREEETNRLTELGMIQEMASYETMSENEVISCHGKLKLDL